MKIEMGIGWVPDEEKPGGLRSANPGEYAAEIVRLRVENNTLRNFLGGIQNTVALALMDVGHGQSLPRTEETK